MGKFIKKTRDKILGLFFPDMVRTIKELREKMYNYEKRLKLIILTPHEGYEKYHRAGSSYESGYKGTPVLVHKDLNYDTQVEFYEKLKQYNTVWEKAKFLRNNYPKIEYKIQIR